MQAKFTRLAAATATHMRLARFAPLLVLAVMWSLPAEVHAQRRTVNGVVRDSAGAPIPEADVSIPSAHLLARTDNSGAFALTRVEPGQTELTVRRLGYVPQSLQIDVRPNNSDTLVVVLTAQAFELQGVAVNEQVKRHLLWIEDFYRRRAKGIGGTFYTREDIEARHASRLSDVLRDAPGVRFVRARGGGSGVRFDTPANFRRDCLPQYFVDGQRVPNIELDDLSARDVEGVLGTGIGFPTVPEGLARIRTIMTATHTRDQLQQALEVLKRVGKAMGILSN